MTQPEKRLIQSLLLVEMIISSKFNKSKHKKDQSKYEQGIIQP